MNLEIKVPDIGDFKNVEIIEVLIKEGDQIKKNDPVLTLESDKSSVEVPSPYDGKISSIKVKVGDKVKQGTVIAQVAASAGATPSAPPATIAAAPAAQLVHRRRAISCRLARRGTCSAARPLRRRVRPDVRDGPKAVPRPSVVSAVSKDGIHPRCALVGRDFQRPCPDPRSRDRDVERLREKEGLT